MQLNADVDVTLHDVLERSVEESAGFFARQTWLVPCVSLTETFSADSGDVFVWEHVGLLLVNFRKRFELCVVIYTDVAQLLHDITKQSPFLRWQ